MKPTSRLVLTDLDGVLTRHWNGNDQVLTDDIPLSAPPRTRHLGQDASPESWLYPIQLPNDLVIKTLSWWHRASRLIIMSARPLSVRDQTERQLVSYGFADVRAQFTESGDHEAYAKLVLAEKYHPGVIVEDDRRIAQFLTHSGYEVILLDRRYNQGPTPERSLVRIKDQDLDQAIRGKGV